MKKWMFFLFFPVCYFCFSAFCFAGVEQAEIAFLKGDYDLAIKNCNEAAAARSADVPGAYYLKGRILLKTNKVQEAQDVFEKILSDFPDSRFCEEAQLGLGDTFFALQDFDKAVGEYRKIQERYKQGSFTAMALYKTGRSLLKSGRMEEARFYFQKLQQEYPLSFESRLIDELDNSEFAYTVQVGCFSKYENAEKLANKLKKQGFDAYISEKEGFPVFYRVRAGRFKTASEAKSCRLSLQKKGYKTKLCP